MTMMTLLAMMTMMTAYIRDITLHLHLLLHLHLHANLHLHCVTLHDKREHQPINQNKMQNFKYYTIYIYIDQYSILNLPSSTRALHSHACLANSAVSHARSIGEVPWKENWVLYRDIL